jgi:hypothetical protein
LKKEQLPKQNISARFMPETFNEESRTIEVVFTTEAPVVRQFLFGERFNEVLGMKPEEVRMGRLTSGAAPVLNSHNRFDLSDQIGVIERAWLDGDKGYAVMRFSKRESIKEIVDDIRDGIYRNVSVGYVVHEFSDVTREDDEMMTLRATDWEPMEISMVTVPADKDAQVREQKDFEKYDCIIRGEQNMENEKEKEKEIEMEVKAEAEAETEVEIEVKTEPEAETETVDVDVFVKAERKRISEITELCKKFDIDQKQIETFIENENKVDDVRKFIVEKLSKEDKSKGTSNMNTNIEVGKTDLEKKKAGIENAILFRAKHAELDENGRRFHNMTLLEMAREILDVRGVETKNLAKWQMAERAFHSTSDFKEILANSLRKSLRAGYDAAPQTFMPFTRMTEVDDLKEISRTQLGEGGLLKEVKEGQEYERDTVSEAAEKYSIQKYGKIVQVTEETLINDDLGAFTRIPAIFGQRARDLESDLAWGVITANANMADGNALFSAAHGNLISAAGGDLSETSLGTGRGLFRKQVGLDGMKLNLSPIYLAVPEDLEVTGEKLLASVQPDSSSNFNPFGPTGRTPLSLIVEPRLGDVSAQEWYLFGSLGQIDMIEMAMLRGANGPMVSQEEGFEVDGLKVKIKHWVGVKAIDWRGMLKSDGVSA